MRKFSDLHEVLLSHGVAPQRFERPLPIKDELLTLAHDPCYVNRFRRGTLSPADWRRIGFVYSPQLVERTFLECAGTVAAASLALQAGLALNLAGGTHHAHFDHGGGYCCLNDLAICGRWLVEEKGVRQALVIDLDVHQGDGTASIVQADQRVLTVSVHCEQNFPLRKAKSDYDVALQAGRSADSLPPCAIRSDSAAS